MKKLQNIKNKETENKQKSWKKYKNVGKNNKIFNALKTVLSSGPTQL